MSFGQSIRRDGRQVPHIFCSDLYLDINKDNIRVHMSGGGADGLVNMFHGIVDRILSKDIRDGI